MSPCSLTHTSPTIDVALVFAIVQQLATRLEHAEAERDALLAPSSTITASSSSVITHVTFPNDLLDAERSSAMEAVDVLFSALGWTSGGLASAAHDVVGRMKAAEAKVSTLEALVRRAKVFVDKDAAPVASALLTEIAAILPAPVTEPAP